MLAQTGNWKDVQKYYQNTYVKFKELGDEPVFINRVNPDVIIGKLHNDETVELRLCDEGYEIDYCIPKKTVFNDTTGKYAVVLERIPARMWKKGLSDENTNIMRIGPQGETTKVPLLFKEIYSFVNKPEYKKLSDLKDSVHSVALSPRFYACANGFIYADGHALGKVIGTKIYHFKQFSEEFKKLFHMSPYTLISVY